ncbi:MAG TPA: C39 family peptidase [Micromonosporaceae bacterium]
MTTFITPLIRKAALTAAGLTITAGAVAGPLTTMTTAAHAAPPAAVQADKPDHGKADKPDNGNGNKGDNGNGAEKKAGAKELAVKYEAQPNFYYCGPAATRNALSADGHDISMDDLAKQMGTTEAGTNSANDITAALNKITGGDKYHTTEIRDPRASDAQKAQLRADIIDALDNNRAVVANIAGTATDTDGGLHSFEGGHYIAVHAYRDGGQQVKIADSANPNTASYWITTDALADWIATRGYSH